MRQVFRMRPWIFPPEPQAIQEIFVRYGVIPVSYTHLTLPTIYSV